MVSRRGFIQKSSLAGLAFGMVDIPQWLINENEEVFSYQSAFLKLALSKERPQFTFFSVDSLGGASFKTNPLQELQKETVINYFSSVSKSGISYFNKKKDKHPVWRFQCDRREIIASTKWLPGQAPAMSLDIPFSQELNHCTVLGRMQEEKRVRFPCLLHFPGMGTFRLHCSDAAVSLFYDADRNVKNPFVKVMLQAADPDHPDITYRFESVTISPETEKTKGNALFDGFRRNYINIFQMNPRILALANNSASDACAFTLYLYAEMARQTPELAAGLTAFDLVRDSLDRYLSGMKAYGQVGYHNLGGGWQSRFDSSDSAPSLIISACHYVLETKDMVWAAKNYNGIREWARNMMATDRNHDGIIEYGYSGNSGSWDGSVRPANWWDTIGFGHDDAYSNILAYQACRLLSRMAALLGEQEDSKDFTGFSDKLKDNYYEHFYNGRTGVLAGWKSADGALHDYYFTFLNSMAVYYGLADGAQANGIMQSLLKKMKESGYTDFRLGLPGNLIPIPKEDYTEHNKRFGYESFQVYENGGATACYSYFTLKALYKLGMRKEADDILLPMLESFKNGDFEGRCPGSKMTKDWKTWTGECWGYEGFLVDNYLALLAVLDH